MKDQCLVLFPYTAQNEDELTLEEVNFAAMQRDTVEVDLNNQNWLSVNFSLSGERSHQY